MPKRKSSSDNNPRTTKKQKHSPKIKIRSRSRSTPQDDLQLWVLFLEHQQSTGWNRTRLYDSRIDSDLIRHLMEYNPNIFSRIFYNIHHVTFHGVEVIDRTLEILNPDEILNQFRSRNPYVGPCPVYDRNSLEIMGFGNLQSFPLLKQIYDNIRTHLDRIPSRWADDRDWRNTLKNLYEELITYLEQDIPNKSEYYRMLAGLFFQPDIGVKFDADELIKYIRYDIEKMLDLYFKALDM